MSRKKYQRHPQLEQVIAELGTLVDRVIADKYGVSLERIAHLRWWYGVPPKRTRLVIPTGVAESLGTDFDHNIAERFGYTVRKIMYWRRLLGIGPHQSLKN